MQHELTYLCQQVEFLKKYRAGQWDKAEGLSMDKKFELIHDIAAKEDNVLNVTELCQIAGVSRSGYYRWVNAEDMQRT